MRILVIPNPRKIQETIKKNIKASNAVEHKTNNCPDRRLFNKSNTQERVVENSQCEGEQHPQWYLSRKSWKILITLTKQTGLFNHLCRKELFDK